MKTNMNSTPYFLQIGECLISRKEIGTSILDSFGPNFTWRKVQGPGSSGSQVQSCRFPPSFEPTTQTKTATTISGFVYQGLIIYVKVATGNEFLSTQHKPICYMCHGQKFDNSFVSFRRYSLDIFFSLTCTRHQCKGQPVSVDWPYGARQKLDCT